MAKVLVHVASTYGNQDPACRRFSRNAVLLTGTALEMPSAATVCIVSHALGNVYLSTVEDFMTPVVMKSVVMKSSKGPTFKLANSIFAWVTSGDHHDSRHWLASLRSKYHRSSFAEGRHHDRLALASYSGLDILEISNARYRITLLGGTSYRAVSTDTVAVEI